MKQENVVREIKHRLGKPPYSDDNLASTVCTEMKSVGYDVSIELVQTILRQMKQGGRQYLSRLS